MWALKEYKNLELAGQAKVTVPAPLYVEKNVILLEFIGKDGKSAPLLREVRLEAPAAWYKKTLEMLRFLHDKVKLVHGDLDRKSTRLNFSHVAISYAVFCLKKKTQIARASQVHPARAVRLRPPPPATCHQPWPRRPAPPELVRRPRDRDRHSPSVFPPPHLP